MVRVPLAEHHLHYFDFSINKVTIPPTLRFYNSVPAVDKMAKKEKSGHKATVYHKSFILSSVCCSEFVALTVQSTALCLFLIR